MNKTSSAVHLQININNISILEGDLKRILTYKDRRISASGVITIKAQGYKSQVRNREDGLKRLQALLQDALRRDKPRRATRPSFGSVQKRLKKKAQRSAIKAGRRKVRRGDE